MGRNERKRRALEEYRNMNTQDRRLVQVILGAMMWAGILLVGGLLGVGIYLVFTHLR